MLKLENFFIYFDLLPILVILLFVKKIKEWSIWAILVYCIYSFTNNLIILYKVSHSVKYLKLLYFFTLFEYLLFATILFLILRNKLVKKFMLVISPAFVLFCFYFIFLSNLKKFDSLQTSVECIILIVLCIYYFFEQLGNPEVEFIYNSYKFWVVVGILLYLAGSFFVFAFATTFSNTQGNNYWSIIYVSGILRNILFAIAVYLSTRPRDEEPYQSLI